MAFMIDPQELKPGLVLFRRADVKHDNWYCRLKIPDEDRYKTVSLKTPDLETARQRAFDEAADLRFRLRHDVPVFDKSFQQVAQEFSDLQRSRADAGQITRERWKVVDSHIRAQLSPYVGNLQISQIGAEKWNAYPLWRKETGAKLHQSKRGGDPAPPSDATIRSEMVTFSSIMRFAASRKYISTAKPFGGKLGLDKTRREAFTPEEYRRLHRFARRWVKESRTEKSLWARSMVYVFVLIMSNTGMRPSEARNLCWRDVTEHTDKHGRPFVSLAVRGKGKARELVAAHNVLDYLERARRLSKATARDDPVFTTYSGESSRSLYIHLIRDLLKSSGLSKGPSGKARTTYCFRHTYATFRLSEGIDIYFLAKQMGTSVQMIEDYYGHITPVKNADRILQGIPGWEPIEDSPEAPATV